jgi:2-methylcitrate dehydratase PrpD
MPLDDSPAVDRLGRFALELRFEEIPEAVAARAGALLLDLIGVAAAGSATEAGRIARDTAAAFFLAGAPDHEARILFDGRPASAVGAAYAGATQIDNFDGHDGYAPCKGHVGAAVLPALLAFAEAGPPVSGREALVCLVLGYEIASRAGLALHASVSDYHTSGAWNALAVAALGSRLRGLSADGLRQAVGIAEYHGPRSQMMREIDNPTMLHDGSGWGALVGVTAVLLAERGFTGAPAVTVEDEAVARFWDDLGTVWLTAEQYIKPYPVCRWAHAPIDAALMLRRDHGLSGDEVAAVEIGTFHESARLAAGMPDSTAMAQYSLAFPVAAALVRGRVGPDEVLGSGLTDPAVARLVAKTTVRREPSYDARFPEGRWGDVTLLLEDGRRLATPGINARGGPEAPLAADEVTAKFRDFAEPVLGRVRAGEIEDRIAALHHPKSRFAPLQDLVLTAIGSEEWAPGRTGLDDPGRLRAPATRRIRA